MGIKEIVALLLFVIPGIIAEKISNKMDFPSADGKTDFKEIVNGILLSLPIVFVVATGSTLKNGFKTLSSFIDAFDDLLFLFTFSITVVIVAIIIGIFKGLIGDFMYSIINKIRSIFNKMEIDGKACWRQAFLEENVPGYVKILKDGVVLEEGFVKHYSLPNEDMCIVLENPKNIDCYSNHLPELKSHLKHSKTYINLEKGVIVELYDTTGVEKYLESINKGSE